MRAVLANGLIESVDETSVSFAVHFPRSTIFLYGPVTHSAEPLIAVFVVGKQVFIHFVGTSADWNNAFDLLPVQFVQDVLPEIGFVRSDCFHFYAGLFRAFKQFMKLRPIHIFAAVNIHCRDDSLVCGHGVLGLVAKERFGLGFVSDSGIRIYQRT